MTMPFLKSFTFATILVVSLASLCITSVHLPLSRRGGRFVTTATANLTSLASILAQVEGKYALTHRSPEHNHLVRRWSSTSDVVDDEHLLQAIGRDGAWYAELAVGEPAQRLAFDIDMLGPDFYTVMTTSGMGAKYDTFASQSHEANGESLHPLCSESTDIFKLGSMDGSVRLRLPICMPPKTSSLTLGSSGSVLGLSTPGSLSRIPGHDLLAQLQQSNHLSQPYWSIAILDAEMGVLSLGDTIAKEMEEAKTRADIELKHYGQPVATPEWVKEQVDSKLPLSMPAGSPMDQHFKWSQLSGSSGWWTSLMPGVWVNGVKVLKNQPVLFDVQCPFVLAPPAAAARFYDSIGASVRLPAPHDMFFAYPCVSNVNIVLELGGWNFPSLSGEMTRADTLHGPPGGRFSLGKLGNGTGYCVGAVVETRMGNGSIWENSGMRGMWVLGEPFFRGMGVVFDAEKQRIGFRSY